MKTLMLMFMLVLSPVSTGVNCVTESNAWQILFNDPATPRFGAKDAKLVLLSFTDHHCPYCKQFDPLLEKLVKEHPDVAVVLKLLPFRGASSISSARAAMTVWQPQPQPLLVYFWATWCGVCKSTTPEVGKLSAEGGNVLSVAIL